MHVGAVHVGAADRARRGFRIGDGSGYAAARRAGREPFPKKAGAPIAAPTRDVDFINMNKRPVSKRRRRQRRGADLILCSTFQFF